MDYDDKSRFFIGFIVIVVIVSVLVGSWMAGSAAAFNSQQKMDQQVQCIRAGGTPFVSTDRNASSDVQCRK